MAPARSFRWQELTDSGRYGAATELAAALGVDRSHVGRVMRLALLPPDIVEDDRRRPGAARAVAGVAGAGAGDAVGGAREEVRDRGAVTLHHRMTYRILEILRVIFASRALARVK